MASDQSLSPDFAHTDKCIARMGKEVEFSGSAYWPRVLAFDSFAQRHAQRGAADGLRLPEYAKKARRTGCSSCQPIELLRLCGEPIRQGLLTQYRRHLA